MPDQETRRVMDERADDAEAMICRTLLELAMERATSKDGRIYPSSVHDRGQGVKQHPMCGICGVRPARYQKPRWKNQASRPDHDLCRQCWQALMEATIQKEKTGAELEAQP